MSNGFFSMLLQILSITNVLFAIVMIFIERKNPAGTWAWLMVLVAIPYVGFVLYLLIGVEGRKRITFLHKAKNDEKSFNDLLKKGFEGLSFIRSQKNYIRSQKNYIWCKDVARIRGAKHLNDLIYLNFCNGHGALTSNNSVSLYHDGKSKFDALLKDISEAEHFIHMLYYIVRDDELGRKIISALCEKARQGVEVRFLVDGMGCYRISKKYFEPLIKAKGKVSFFLPPHFGRVNYRNHRKIAVIDGKIGYIGGLNIGDEYLGKVKRFGYWRDTHIRVTGDSVKSLEIRFMLDWDFSSDDKMHFYEKYFPVYDYPNKTVISQTIDIPAKGVFINGMTIQNVPMQIVSSGPDTKWSYIHYGYNKMIAEADKSIYIQTPYFSPDDSIFESLRIAALSGIDVRIIIPAHPDHPFVYWASLSYLGELLEAGVKCYEYTRGFIHSKLLLIDSLVTSTGTANMDFRSFKLNFEVNAFIYDRTTTKSFEEKFLKDLADCKEITMEIYNNRSTATKIKESVSRLLSPLL